MHIDIIMNRMCICCVVCILPFIDAYNNTTSLNAYETANFGQRYIGIHYICVLFVYVY